MDPVRKDLDRWRFVLGTYASWVAACLAWAIVEFSIFFMVPREFLDTFLSRAAGSSLMAVGLVLATPAGLPLTRPWAASPGLTPKYLAVSTLLVLVLLEALVCLPIMWLAVFYQ